MGPISCIFRNDGMHTVSYKYLCVQTLVCNWSTSLMSGVYRVVTVHLIPRLFPCSFQPIFYAFSTNSKLDTKGLFRPAALCFHIFEQRLWSQGLPLPTSDQEHELDDRAILKPLQLCNSKFLIAQWTKDQYITNIWVSFNHINFEHYAQTNVIYTLRNKVFRENIPYSGSSISSLLTALFKLP